MSQRSEGWTRFEAWGTYVHLQTDRRVDAAEQIARELLEEVGGACSRFRSDSDLSLVNAGAGSWVACSPTLLAAVEVALDAAASTDGLVDPLLGRPLVALGYDRDFADLVLRRSVGVPGARPGAWREIEIDPAGPALRIPSGTALDLGATAKAWTSDVLAETLLAELDTSVLVSLGGDIRIAARRDDERDWPVRITEHPDEEAAEVVLLDSGGLATSSTVVRTWTSGGVVRHHLLDPRTGYPACGPWRTVTATGPTCVAANVATTAALVLQDGAEEWLRRQQVDARLVSRDGHLRTTGRWPVPENEEALACSTS